MKCLYGHTFKDGQCTVCGISQETCRKAIREWEKSRDAGRKEFHTDGK